MMLYFDNTSIPAGGLAGCCSLPNTIKKSLITNECVINDKIYRIKLLDNQMPQGGAAAGHSLQRQTRQAAGPKEGRRTVGYTGSGGANTFLAPQFLYFGVKIENYWRWILFCFPISI